MTADTQTVPPTEQLPAPQLPTEQPPAEQPPAEQPPAEQPPVVPLRRNLRFQALWFGTTASTLGVSVADIAYPLAILAITGSPAWAGLFAAVQTTGMLLCGLPAGSLADRFSSRTVVLVGETLRAAITIAVIAGLAGHWLNLPLLLAAGALLGGGQSVCGAARLMLLRSVVAPSQLTSALTQDEVRMQAAGIGGPALGGALYGVRALAHAVPFLFTAAAFVISALTVVLAGKSAGQHPAGDAPAGAAAEREGGMLAGLRFLLASPFLRAAITLIMIINTLGAGLDLVVIVLLRHQGVRPGTIGLVLGLGATGAMVGVPLVRVFHRLRPGVLIAGASLLLVPVFALLAVPLGPWWAASLLFAGTLAVPAMRVAVDVLVIRQAPAERRGRVISALITLIALGVPLGMAGCGLLLRYLSAQAAMLTLAVVLAAGLAWAATRRELWQARWPAQSRPTRD